MTPSDAESSRPSFPDIPAAQLQRARRGDATALAAVSSAVQPGLFNFALRMLGSGDDARAAMQAIIARLPAALEQGREDLSFSTVVIRLACEVLRTAPTCAQEAPALTYAELGARVQAGLTLHHPAPVRLSAADRGDARGIALACTQSMLMALDRESRMLCVLSQIFRLSTEQVTAVFEVTPAVHQERLARAEAQLVGFMQSTCGLVNEDASCRCHRQLPAVRAAHASAHARAVPGTGVALPTPGSAAATYEQLTELRDADDVMRTLPVYAPARA